MRKRRKEDTRLPAKVSASVLVVVAARVRAVCRLREADGFTLIELLIVLAVAAILTVVAAPSMADLIRRNRIAVANNDIVAAFQYARATALNRGRAVTLCPTLDQFGCADQDDWSAAWLIAVDGNASGAPAIREILLVGDAVAPAVRAVAESATSYFRFTPGGDVAWSGTGGGAERAIRVDAPRCRDREARRIILNRIGRVRSEPSSCA